MGPLHILVIYLTNSVIKSNLRLMLWFHTPMAGLCAFVYHRFLPCKSTSEHLLRKKGDINGNKHMYLHIDIYTYI